MSFGKAAGGAAVKAVPPAKERLFAAGVDQNTPMRHSSATATVRITMT